MKICALIPCLMLENNRVVNKKYIQSNIDTLLLDEYIIYDQCFATDDFLEGGTYIGHASIPQGFVEPRNELLKWFYQSDYDYAFWIDANSYISKSTLNSYYTLLDALKTKKITVDATFSSLGIMPSSERIKLSSQFDYFTTLRLLPSYRYTVKTLYWLHGCFIKNFRKYYNETPYISEECNPHDGKPEDAWFSTYLRKHYDTYLVPSIVLCKPSSKTSTWMKNEGSYAYPKEDWKWIIETASVGNPNSIDTLQSGIIELPRVERYKEFLTAYKPKLKQKNSFENSLF